MALIHPRSVYDLSNPYMRAEAGSLIYLVAQHMDGSLGGALMCAVKPHNWYPQADGRSAKMREYRAAEKELWAALQRFDNARIAACKS